MYMGLSIVFCGGRSFLEMLEYILLRGRVGSFGIVIERFRCS